MNPNTNTILKSLFNGKITVKDLDEVIGTFNKFQAVKKNILDAGLIITVHDALADEYPPDVREIAHTLGVAEALVANFKLMFPKIKRGDYYNKLELVREFRNRFSVGLGGAKEAIETLYDHEVAIVNE